MDNIFTKISIGKILAVLCVECEGLKDLIHLTVLSVGFVVLLRVLQIFFKEITNRIKFAIKFVFCVLL